MAAFIDQVQLGLLIQQWQLVQHCFSQNSDKVDELNTTVQGLSSTLEAEQTFSAGLNACLREFSESVSRRFDAIDQNIKEQLVIERKVRERQFQALAQIVREEFQSRMVHVFEEGLLREKTAREDSSAQLREIIEAERGIRRKMQRELMREKEAREQLRSKIEHRLEPIGYRSGARSCTNSESPRDRKKFGTAPKLRSEADANATLATAVVRGTGGTNNMEEDCRLQAAGKHLTASGSPASLTGTWQFNSTNGWTRFSIPAVQLGTQQQQQKSQSVVLSVNSPRWSGPGPLHKSPQVFHLDAQASGPGPRGSADCTSRGISPRLVPSMLEVTQLQVQHQLQRAQVQQQPQLQQQHQVQQQVQQQQQSQKPQQSQQKHPSLSPLLRTLQSRMQRSSMPFNLLDLPERERTV